MTYQTKSETEKPPRKSTPFTGTLTLPPEVLLDRGIPLPPDRMTGAKYPFRHMKPGECFTLPWASGLNNRIRWAAWQWGQRNGREFLTRVIIARDPLTDEPTRMVRCWRIDNWDPENEELPEHDESLPKVRAALTRLSKLCDMLGIGAGEPLPTKLSDFPALKNRLKR